MKLELAEKDIGILVGVLELALEESTPRSPGGERRVHVLRELLLQLTGERDASTSEKNQEQETRQGREVRWAKKRAREMRDLYFKALNTDAVAIARDLLPLVWKYEREAEDLGALDEATE